MPKPTPTQYICPQCGHTGAPAWRLRAIGWACLIAIPIWAAFVAALTGFAVAQVAAERPWTSDGVNAATYWVMIAIGTAFGTGVLGLIAWLTLRRVCGACGWRHIRSATAAEAATTATDDTLLAPSHMHPVTGAAAVKAARAHLDEIDRRRLRQSET